MNATWIRQLQSCFNRGWKCAKAGGSPEDCPYKNPRSGGNVQRQRAQYWLEGFRQAKENGQPSP